MFGAGAGGERPDVGELVSTILAIIVLLFHSVYRVSPVRRHQRGQREQEGE